MVNIKMQACKQIHSEAGQEDPRLEAGKFALHSDTGLQAVLHIRRDHRPVKMNLILRLVSLLCTQIQVCKQIHSKTRQNGLKLEAGK
jgi:hypothetical protein